MNEKKNSKTWRVYLSGEIHTDWRECIQDGARQNSLPVESVSYTHLTLPKTPYV